MVTSQRPKRLKVMVVDDDEVVLEVTRERLDAAGYEVLVRQSSLGTSAAILRDKPDILLLDVRMPGLDGAALATLLSSKEAHIRPAIILHSSTGREQLEQLADRCGAIGVIEKTGNTQSFLRQFSQCVAAR
jgi:CheY-like chemotaxis protein